METKTCSLTEEEIQFLIADHGKMLDHHDFEDRIERIVYLNKRLKAKPKDDKPEDQPKTQMDNNSNQAAVGTEQKATPTW